MDDISAIETPGKPARGTEAKLVKPVVNSLAIIRLLTTATEPMNVSQISGTLGLNVSTCFYILRTLVHERILKFDAHTRLYSIGIGVFDLLQGALAHGDALPIVRPMMEKIARDHGISTTLWRADGDRLTLVALGESDADMRIHLRVGQRVPLLVGAMGRLVAAHSGRDEEQLRRMFDEVRWNSPIKFETFMSQAKRALRTGWAVDDGQFAGGTLTVSVPVFDRAGTFSMACSGTMFKGQHDPDRVKEIAEELRKIGRVLTPPAAAEG